MKYIKIISVIIFAIFAASCNKNRVYEVHLDNFPSFRWDTTNIAEYSPEIADKESTYKLFVAFRHVAGFQMKTVKVNLEITSPAGEKTSKDYILSLFDNQNNSLSECAGDFCDLETLIEPNFKFTETGKYQFKIKQLTEINPLPNVMEVGLIIDKIEK